MNMQINDTMRLDWLSRRDGRIYRDFAEDAEPGDEPGWRIWYDADGLDEPQFVGPVRGSLREAIDAAMEQRVTVG